VKESLRNNGLRSASKIMTLGGGDGSTKPKHMARLLFRGFEMVGTKTYGIAGQASEKMTGIGNLDVKIWMK